MFQSQVYILCFLPGPYLYQSFRTGRQFNYLQLGDESGDDKIPTCPPPARPPQPKSVSVPVSMATDSLLIDLSDEMRKKEAGQSSSLSNGTSHGSGSSLLDSSIADKYQYLPQPIGNTDSVSADPFEIRTSLTMLLPTVVSSAHSSPSRQQTVTPEANNLVQPQVNTPSQQSNEYSNISPELPPKMYTNVPSGEQEPVKAKCSPASSTWTSMSAEAGHHPYYATPPSVNMTSSAVNDDKYKAFEWVNDAVAGFSLDKHSDRSVQDNMNGHTEKSALGSWKEKDWTPLYESKTVGQSVFYDACSDKSEPSMYANISATETFADVLNDVSVKDVRNMDHVRSRQDNKHQPVSVQVPNQHGVHQAQCRSTDAAPALPPRAPLGKTSVLSNSSSREHLVRIQPVVQSGEQVSYTHYWLLPEKERQMAERRCSSAAGQHSDWDQYENMNASNLCLSAAVNTGHSLQRDHSHKSWHAARANSSDMYQNVGGLTVALPSVTSASSMSSLQSKIDRVHQLVHGVTQEECHTALAANQWSVDAAMKYLKVEQLFRLGVTTRERCKQLLETFQWNLETAGSVLLDELHVGSSV